MMGLELVVGYLSAYAFRKARRAGRGVDKEVDRAIDEGLERLHEIVSRKLGDDPSVLQLEREAQAGIENPRSSERVRLALEEAAQGDAEFAGSIEQALAQLKAAGGASVVAPSVRQLGIASHGSTVIQAGRDINQAGRDRNQQTWTT
ncbi:MAG TPA: hypothetical protein VGI58_03230 [Streptosporangiaceae bacterium]